MTLYAFDDIDDAIDATRALLWPFDLRRWAKLALVVFFVGGVGSGFNPFQFTSNAPSGGGGSPPAEPGTLPSIGPEVWSIIAVVVAAVVAITLLFLFIGSIMEFVFVESLRRETVTIRRYWGERWRQGIRLFAFRVVLGILTVGIVAVVGIVALAPIVFGDGGVSVPLVVLAILVFVVVTILGGLVHGFTTVFVIPVMIAEECGVLAGWRRFWPTMTGQWKQYLVYAVMGFVLQIAAGIVAGIAILILAITLLIPFGIVGLLGAGLLTVSELAGWIVIGLVAVVFVLALIALVLLVAVPIQTFLRYYALFVLGDTNETFDLIPERRQAVREDDVGASGTAD